MAWSDVYERLDKPQPVISPLGGAPGPVFAAPYHLDPVRGPQPGVDGYGRTDNPTWRALESAIGELEGGDCVVFSSGMAAISALLLTVPRPGQALRAKAAAKAAPAAEGAR